MLSRTHPYLINRAVAWFLGAQGTVLISALPPFFFPVFVRGFGTLLNYPPTMDHCVFLNGKPIVIINNSIMDHLPSSTYLYTELIYLYRVFDFPFFVFGAFFVTNYKHRKAFAWHLHGKVLLEFL